MLNPADFFEKSIPAAFRRNKAELEEKVLRLTRALEDVRAADAVVQMKLLGDGGGSWLLKVKGGEIAAERGETEDAALTVAQEAASFRPSGGDRLSGEGFLLRLLAKSKLDRIAGQSGTIQFRILEIEPGRDHVVTVKAGRGPLPEKPDCTVEMKGQDYREVEAGKLAPQAAFMGGKVKITGNMNVALQLGSIMFLN